MDVRGVLPRGRDRRRGGLARLVRDIGQHDVGAFASEELRGNLPMPLAPPVINATLPSRRMPTSCLFRVPEKGTPSLRRVSSSVTHPAETCRPDDPETPEK